MTDRDWNQTVRIPVGGNAERILVVAHAWYGDLIGGAFRLASEFAVDLAAAGCDVDYVCCAPAKGHFPAREEISGLTVHRYPALRGRSWPVGRLRHHVRQTARIVQQLLRGKSYDAVSGHSPLQARGAFPVIRRLQPHAFINYTVHSPFDDELIANAPRSWARRTLAHVAGRIDRRNCRLADCVQHESQYALHAMQRKHPLQVADKGRAVPGWVDFSRFSRSGTRAQARAALGESWHSDVPLFFTLRRLESRMGLDTLIEAAALVRDRGLAFRVLIGGTGSQRASLEQLIRDHRLTDHVHLIGRVEEADLPACYAAADCFVLPTRALECFGLIVLESFAAGTPVIASRAAAIPELADRQGPGWDFEPGDAHGLVRRMQAFINRELLPSRDLLQIAREFDRPEVFQQWRSLLTGACRQELATSLPDSNRTAQPLQSVNPEIAGG